MENPFKPTAGKTPPELIGREEVLNKCIEGLDNGAGAPGRLIRITGVRGMGKTRNAQRTGQTGIAARLERGARDIERLDYGTHPANAYPTDFNARCDGPAASTRF